MTASQFLLSFRYLHQHVFVLLVCNRQLSGLRYHRRLTNGGRGAVPQRRRRSVSAHRSRPAAGSAARVTAGSLPGDAVWGGLRKPPAGIRPGAPVRAPVESRSASTAKTPTATEVPTTAKVPAATKVPTASSPASGVVPVGLVHGQVDADAAAVQHGAVQIQRRAHAGGVLKRDESEPLGALVYGVDDNLGVEDFAAFGEVVNQRSNVSDPVHAPNVHFVLGISLCSRTCAIGWRFRSALRNGPRAGP
eukprot:CAMPEP_0114236462 /NCGR_PEP_ID=MMETSP0058-20121206/6855_1 /TAXON_ID=36894 /ORGANISM="Pyramimonas parkeae, CCMP726" /LENGTH=247 /DNA_ID=CAMNT_0001348409 /DNA_START=589 /DNA_END=1332 /DNA_ORIENTATION=+